MERLKKLSKNLNKNNKGGNATVRERVFFNGRNRRPSERVFLRNKSKPSESVFFDFEI